METPSLNVQQAKAEIANFRRVFRAFAEADHAIAVLENFDAVIRERRAAVDATVGQKEIAEAALAAAQRELATVQESVASLRDEESRLGSLVALARDVGRAQEALAIGRTELATVKAEVDSLRAEAARLQPVLELAGRIGSLT
jgi:hypothetical protein